MARRSTSGPEAEPKQGRCLLALWKERPREHRMLVESTESVWLRWNSKEGGKGIPKNVTGKGVGSLEQGEQAAVAESQPHPALASSLDLASFQTLVRSPHSEHEGWLRWTYDTGAAISAFPLDAGIGTETQANDCSYTFRWTHFRQWRLARTGND